MRSISNIYLTSSIARRARVFAGDSGGGLASVPAFAVVDAKRISSLIVWYRGVNCEAKTPTACYAVNRDFLTVVQLSPTCHYDRYERRAGNALQKGFLQSLCRQNTPLQQKHTTTSKKLNEKKNRSSGSRSMIVTRESRMACV